MLLFVAAVLIMVGAIWLAGAVGRMWILIPVMALDLLVTLAVLVAVAWLVGDDEGPDGGQDLTARGGSGHHRA